MVRLLERLYHFCAFKGQKPGSFATHSLVVFGLAFSALSGCALRLNGTYLLESQSGSASRHLLGVENVTLLNPGFLTVETDGASRAPVFSPDGSLVAFKSSATNLDGSCTNGAYHIFVKSLNDGVVTCISTDSGGREGDSNSTTPVFSHDGNMIAFSSTSTNLDTTCSSGKSQVFVKNLTDGSIKCVSTDAAEIGSTNDSFAPAFSADGTLVAFSSTATNLDAACTSGKLNIFVKNPTDGSVTCISTEVGGDEGDADSFNPIFSPDRNLVVFSSTATNLDEVCRSGTSHIFIKNRTDGTITCVSDNGGTEGNGASNSPVFSPDGNLVVFASSATNLDTACRSGASHIFIKNLTDGATTCISTDSGGREGDSDSFTPVFSTDGNLVAFSSGATHLVAGDTNGIPDIFLKNLTSGAITRISPADDGSVVEADGSVGVPVFSPDGNLIAFQSDATNLVAGDTNVNADIFVKNLTNGVIRRISTDSLGNQANNFSFSPVFSPDSNLVAFESAASNLVTGGLGGRNVFVKNLTSGVTTLISADGSGNPGVGGGSWYPAFSPDGSLVAFSSAASNLVAGDTNGVSDIFVKNLSTGAITRVSTDSLGSEGNGGSATPIFSSDGSLIAFSSTSTNLVAGDTNGVSDAFVKNLSTGAIIRISTDSLGSEGNGVSSAPIFSPDGSLVAFSSTSTNLVASDTNGVSDIFVKDLSTGAIIRISTDSLGSEGNGVSSAPTFNSDGSLVAFSSTSTNLVAGDTNGTQDLFVKNLSTGAVTRVSTDSLGSGGNGTSGYPAFSPDGNKVVFQSPPPT